MASLLSIGEFSARCGLSARVLRSYAAAGLLVPAAVDAYSGYRYYAVAQVQRAEVIRLLREAGVPVRAIADFLEKPDLAQIDVWEMEMARQLDRRRAALATARDQLAVLAGDAREEGDYATRRGHSMAHSLIAGIATDRGGRDSNQDAAMVGEALCAVADGIGGLEDGEIASHLALEALGRSYASDPTAAGLVKACHDANQAVWARATTSRTESAMGTTVAALAITSDGEAVAVHVGDSRLYLVDDGGLSQLTDDHSVVADLVRAGELTEEEAESHPDRFVLTRAIGVGPHVEVGVTGVTCARGDRLLLCTDGLYKAVDRGRIREVLATERRPQQAADDLVAEAVGRGAEDNVTVAVIDVA